VRRRVRRTRSVCERACRVAPNGSWRRCQAGGAFRAGRGFADDRCCRCHWTRRSRSQGAVLVRRVPDGVSELWVPEPGRCALLWRLRDRARERPVPGMPGGRPRRAEVLRRVWPARGRARRPAAGRAGGPGCHRLGCG
jgi:hypothetical protein